MCRTFRRKPDDHSDVPFESVYADLNGPINVSDCDFKYVFEIIDDYSSYIAIYLMQSKSDTPQVLKQYIADHAPFGTTKKLRSDRGTEFTSNIFQQILLDRGIKFETSSPYSQFQNGRIERSWQTLFDIVRCLLVDSNAPRKLYPYVLKYAAYNVNRK